MHIIMLTHHSDNKWLVQMTIPFLNVPYAAHFKSWILKAISIISVDATFNAFNSISLWEQETENIFQQSPFHASLAFTSSSAPQTNIHFGNSDADKTHAWLATHLLLYRIYLANLDITTVEDGIEMSKNASLYGTAVAISYEIVIFTNLL